jgi:hypothetical protein
MMAVNTYCDGFSSGINVDVRVAPILDRATPAYRLPCAEFFSDKTQKALLSPLRTLRNMKHFRIPGRVSNEVAASVEQDARADIWDGDPNAIVDKLRAEKEEGTRIYKSGMHLRAGSIWAGVSADITRMQNSSAWDRLVACGGPTFVDNLAELLFLAALNAAQAVIGVYGDEVTGVQKPTETPETRQTLIDHLLFLVYTSSSSHTLPLPRIHFLFLAYTSLHSDFWKGNGLETVQCAARQVTLSICGVLDTVRPFLERWSCD